MRSLRTILFAALALSVAVPGGLAQNRPNIPPEMQARMRAWQKFRDSHKNVFALQRTVGALEELEKDKKTQLTKAQAQKILPVLKAWRGKPVMTDAQALKVNKQITAPLSLAQLKKVAASGDRRTRRPGGPGGFNGTGGQPGAGGARAGAGNRPRGNAGNAPRFDASRFPAPKEYNPLNPNTIPMERQRTRAKQSLDNLTKRLTARAAGK